jgi:hypothetical protein
MSSSKRKTGQFSNCLGLLPFIARGIFPYQTNIAAAFSVLSFTMA